MKVVNLTGFTVYICVCVCVCVCVKEWQKQKEMEVAEMWFQKTTGKQISTDMHQTDKTRE